MGWKFTSVDVPGRSEESRLQNVSKPGEHSGGLAWKPEHSPRVGSSVFFNLLRPQVLHHQQLATPR